MGKRDTSIVLVCVHPFVDSRCSFQPPPNGFLDWHVLPGVGGGRRRSASFASIVHTAAAGVKVGGACLFRQPSVSWTIVAGNSGARQSPLEQTCVFPVVVFFFLFFSFCFMMLEAVL